MVISLTVPEKGKCLVKSGQKVTFTTPLFEEIVQEEFKAYIATKLHISPEHIFKHLKKFVGDEVKKGEIVAEKKGLFSKVHYKSEVDGLIREISHTDGAIIISVDSGDDLITMSPLIGEVEEVSKKEVTIKISKSRTYEAKAIEGECGGRLLYVKNEHDLISEDEVDGAVVCAQSLAAYNQMKYEALGAVGFVVQRSLPEETSIPFAIVKTIQEFEAIQKAASPSCFLSKGSGTIVCYG